MKALSLLRRCYSASSASQLNTLQPPPGPTFEDLPSYSAYDPERMHLLWEQLSKQYGPVFQVKNFAGSSMYFLSDVQDIHKIFNVTAKNPIRPFFESYGLVRKLNENKFFEEGKLGLLCQHGEEWWRVRSRTQVQTNKPQTVATYIPKMDEIGNDFVERMAKLRNEKNELPDDFVKELYKWALESVALVALNKRIGGFEGSEDAKKLTEAADKIMSSIGECEYGDKSWRHTPNEPFIALRENHDYWLNYTQSEVDKCYEQLLSKLSRKADDLGNLNIMETLLLTPGLSRKDVITTMMDFVMSAIDTTALTAASALYCLASNPAQQRKLQQEIDTVLHDSNVGLTAAHMGNIPFTKSVLKETLRLYPTSPLDARQTLEDTEFSGAVIPKDAQVMLLLQPMGKDENNFTSPAEFLPERWIRDNSFQASWNHNKLAYLPFGLGNRSCIARRLAEYEIYSLIIKLFQKYDLQWKQQDLNPKSHVQLYPDLPLKFTMTER